MTIPVVEDDTLRAVVKRRIDRKAYHVLGQGRNVLFNADALQDTGRVFICEAPFDAILAARELPGWAVVSPIAGCRSWPTTTTLATPPPFFFFVCFPLPPGYSCRRAWILARHGREVSIPLHSWQAGRESMRFSPSAPAYQCFRSVRGQLEATG